MHIFHKWGKWSAPKQTTVTTQRTLTGYPVGDTFDSTVFIQERTCLECGKYQRRVLNIDGDEL